MKNRKYHICIILQSASHTAHPFRCNKKCSANHQQPIFRFSWYRKLTFSLRSRRCLYHPDLFFLKSQVFDLQWGINRPTNSHRYWKLPSLDTFLIIYWDPLFLFSFKILFCFRHNWKELEIWIPLHFFGGVMFRSLFRQMILYFFPFRMSHRYIFFTFYSVIDSFILQRQ